MSEKELLKEIKEDRTAGKKMKKNNRKNIIECNN